MTYFLEFHTPRGIFTSVPQTEEEMKKIKEIFVGMRHTDVRGFINVLTSGGTFTMTTDMIRQTILVTREAE